MVIQDYFIKILFIDLNTKKATITKRSKKFAIKYIGGNGYGINMLMEHCPPLVDPFTPENPLIFAIGPFAGTIVPTSNKYAVYSKSPLTGFLGEGISSGSISGEIKSAGLDIIVIKGRSDVLSYIWIDDDNVQIRNAEKMKGMDSWLIDTAIREELGDPNIKVAGIGIAGEKKIRFACITTDRSRQVGRTGLGAVMGSKNLKAIAVRGTGSVNVAHPDELLEICKDINKRCQGPTTEKYRKYGTPANLLAFNELGILPTKNFQQSVFEQAEKVSGEHLYEEYLERIVSCSSCPIACDHIARVKSGKFKTSEVGVDYETIYALGPNLGISELDAIIKANELCDRLGIDTISAGGTIAYAMECYERGIITKQDTGGLELTFGNSDALIELVKGIGYREGIGNILAEGSRKAAEIIGKGSERYAIHIKGLELPGYDIRGLKTAALGFGTSTRGACHLRSGSYGPDIKGSVDRFIEEFDRGKIVKDLEDTYTLFDSLILCKFIRSTIRLDELPVLYKLVTGIELSERELCLAGERTYNLERLFNIREGATRRDDMLPQRMYMDPIPEGPGKGSVVSLEGYENMLDGYYTSRGWDMEGIPSREKLEELDILNQSIK